MDRHLSTVRFDRYKPYLQPLYRQLESLKILNTQMMWNLQVPNAWFTGLSTTEDHDQSVEDLSTFFVVKDTLRATLDYNWRLIELTQPGALGVGFEADVNNLRLDPRVRVYSPGIYRVRISLADYWAYKDGQTVNGVCKPASASDKKLNGVEIIGAYGLQDPKLLRMQNGINLPHCKLIGLQQGRDFSKVPFFYWDFIAKRACLFSRSMA